MNLRWIQDAADDPEDLCAHGDVEFRIGDDVLVEPEVATNLTVSAAALYLLRTLSEPHFGTGNHLFGEKLFPCCGFTMFDVAGEDDVLICGCPGGQDFEVLHDVDGHGVVVRAPDHREWLVGWADWQAAVFGFADQVSAFYEACSPKRPAADDLPGFNKFKAEWHRRRGTELVQGRE